MTAPRLAIALLAATAVFAISAQAAESGIDARTTTGASTVTREQVTAEFLRARAAGELDFSRQFEPSNLSRTRDNAAPQAASVTAPSKAAEQQPATGASEAKAAYRQAMAVGDEDRGRTLSVAALTDGQVTPAEATTTRHASAPSEYTGTLQ
ncbi:DUF4148 domain-containing protein [Aquabacterium sp.]|uniref:DUF4148 domain-containing protein n=1 Tax=Aquabacterium sp. TaxID=1872578 RepID=UPI0025C16B03|nr:DUF4148 domain-containing protein [Aquabacterium sp.]